MRDLNAMHRINDSGAPDEMLKGHAINTNLPNQGGPSLNLKRERELHKRAQQRWMRKLRRISTGSFNVGDPIRLQNICTKKWYIKGVVDNVRVLHEDAAKSYTVVTEDGRCYLRNGKFLRIRWSKIRFQGVQDCKKVDFSLVGSSKSSLLAAQCNW